MYKELMYEGLCGSHDLYSPPSIIRITKLRRMRWASHIARMGEKRNGKDRGKETTRKTKT
jgi:hypothetical protein